jgi:hypothetical protein
MESETKSGRTWWMLVAKSVAWGLLVLVLYVSAYYALVVRAKAKTRSGVVVVIPIYPAQWMHALFEPMHQVDRASLRPDAWTP